MSYEKHTWQTGEVITAEKLNNLEAGVESGQNGYEITDTYTTLIDTLNIVATNGDEYNPPYCSLMDDLTEEGSEFISNKTGTETLRITFDGEEYLAVGNINYWGASNIGDDGQTISWDWSRYPFSFGGSGIVTKIPGEHTLKVELVERSSEPSADFKLAVSNVVDEVRPESKYVGAFVIELAMDNESLSNCTFNEIKDAFYDGALLFVKKYYSEALIHLESVRYGTVSVDSFKFNYTHLNSNGYMTVDEITINKSGTVSFVSKEFGPLTEYNLNA